ncbi:bifunctional 3'-5' exonuclease/DNA polymerase [Arthrobacter sp. ISL-30]|uniref:bifunctional 3'-5' exonuclease/DNA polymerase n=1 Tax=Arthrobacter sp. ISL-30 TaxID=2819109 RepID=UPI001BEB025B|nr:bifunctional 3'-5' exonuclease/DNA polymerase [Arthrobacter sp. ISL-30]MBT2515074.1 bifunctional 3'-5' exonuclease/DNA polymerase [Arthrobacter sp. ISL-30]
MYLLLATHPDGAAIQEVTSAGLPVSEPTTVPASQLPDVVRSLEARRPRWVWHRTQDWYPSLLTAGVELERCHDLSLCGAILAHSQFTAHTDFARNAEKLILDDEASALPRSLQPPPPSIDQAALFEEPSRVGQPDLEDVRATFSQQQQALAKASGAQANTPARGAHAAETAQAPSDADIRQRLRLLLAAESAGAMIAAEMQHTGVPWREELHEEILADHLGERPLPGHRPAKLQALCSELRELLSSPQLNPDSPQELMRALHRNGIEVKSTRQWELKESTHPAIEPLLAYKKLQRLHTANGWAWLDAWVKDGRFRPEYVVGGVVSGRWASRGGGALQIPRQIRGAVHADPGHKLIVADASQLEPRVLVALARDAKMAEAARGKDLYAGIAEQGFGGDRAKAKIALLGAIYGATTGESGRLMPQLARMYPRAVDYVEQAARAGEAGRTVTSSLGRSSPPPSERWIRSQQSSTAEEQRRADNIARSRGRFTRNFVVQGSAADWASCWLAELRRRLRARRAAGSVSGELVFFLHDEVMVHAPDAAVESCIAAIEEAAESAKRLLFGPVPVEFPVSIAVVDSYDSAK